MVKQLIFKLLKNIINSLIAGFIFGICACGFILVGNEILGMLIAGLGVLLTLLYGYDAFITRVPYLVENKYMYAFETLLSLVFNLLGALLIGLLCSVSNIIDVQSLNLLDEFKSISDINIFICALFAGFMIYFGVNTYKKAEQPIARFLVLFIWTSVAFIFGKCIVCYYPVYLALTGFPSELTGKFFIMLLGNILGGLIVPLLRLLRSKL